MNGAPGLQTWRPWATTTATLYFVDGGSLFPASRRMSTSDDLPRAALQALLAGPTGGSGLTSAIPPGVEIRSFELEAPPHLEPALCTVCADSILGRRSEAQQILAA